MEQIKGLIVTALVIAGFLVVFGHKLPFTLPEPIRGWNARLRPQTEPLLGGDLGNINLGNLSQNFGSLVERSKIMQETMSQITSEAIKADTQGKPLTDKALEYGRYVYCQQVVSEWQKQNP